MLLPARRAKIKKVSTEQLAANSKELKNTMATMGFSGISNQLDKSIHQGSNAFTIDLSYYVNEKERIEFSFSFVNMCGGYALNVYTAALSLDGKPSNIIQQILSAEHGKSFTAKRCMTFFQ